MNSESPTLPQPQSIEEGVKAMVQDFKEKASDTRGIYEAKIRQSPDKAILIALAAGYCIHVLPMRSLIALPLRLTAFLAKPTLLALGAAKAFQLLQEQSRK